MQGGVVGPGDPGKRGEHGEGLVPVPGDCGGVTLGCVPGLCGQRPQASQQASHGPPATLGLLPPEEQLAGLPGLRG